MTPHITLDVEVWAAADVTRGAITKALARLGAWGLGANVTFRIVGDAHRFGAGALLAAPDDPPRPIADRLAALRPFFAPCDERGAGDVRVVLVNKLFSPRDPIQRIFGEGAGIGLCPACAHDGDDAVLYKAIAASPRAPGVAFVSTENAARDTLAHEVFHALGLTHTDDATNIMRTSAGDRRCAPVLTPAQRNVAASSSTTPRTQP